MEQVAFAGDFVAPGLGSGPAVEQLQRLEVGEHSSVVELELDGAAAAAAAAEVACRIAEYRMESLYADRFAVPYQVGRGDCCSSMWSVNLTFHH